MFKAEGRRDNLPVICAEHADTRKMDGTESLDNNRQKWGQSCWKETKSTTNSQLIGDKGEVTTHIFSLWTVYIKLWPIFARTCWFWENNISKKCWYRYLCSQICTFRNSSMYGLCIEFDLCPPRSTQHFLPDKSDVLQARSDFLVVQLQALVLEIALWGYKCKHTGNTSQKAISTHLPGCQPAAFFTTH